MPNSNVSLPLRSALWTEKVRRDPADSWAWTMAHRMMAGRLPIHLPALAAIARDLHPGVVVQKSAQVGATELFVNLALWAADTRYALRGHVLFLMPTQNQMDDFAQSRFDRAIQDSPYLRGRLQPEPPRRKGADSKRLKRVGDGYIFLRGADSRRQVDLRGRRPGDPSMSSTRCRKARWSSRRSAWPPAEPASCASPPPRGFQRPGSTASICSRTNDATTCLVPPAAGANR